MASTDLPRFLQHKKALRPRGDVIRNEKNGHFRDRTHDGAITG
jgi:hypothetical protein